MILRMNRETDGLASIIISHQNQTCLKECLASIEHETKYPYYEVIVVDNIFNEETRSFLRSEETRNQRLRFLLNEEKTGFAHAINEGLAVIKAEAQYIVILNNIIVTPGWLDGLVRWLRDGSVGMVGPVTGPNGSSSEAVVPLVYSNLEEMGRVAVDYADAHQGQCFDISCLTMQCAAIRRDLFDQVGPMDETFSSDVFEDDYSLRVRNAGYRVICAQDVVVHHMGRVSFLQSEEEQHRNILNSDKKRYEDKWGVKWRPQTMQFDFKAELDAAHNYGRASNRNIVSASRPMDKKVSIVLINYNNREFTEPCLQSLAKMEQPGGGLEIIVVDNASSNDELSFLKHKYPHIRGVQNRFNLGFAKASNRGAEEATGDYVVFLNNDMCVETNWLTELLRGFEKESCIGCVGSLILNFDGTEIDFAGRPDDAFHIRFYPSNAAFAPANTPDYSKDRYLFFVSGGAMAIKRDLFLEIGGFDPRLFLFHDDVDFGWRLWSRGYRSLLCTKSIVYHHGSVTVRKHGPRIANSLLIKHPLWIILKNSDEEQVAELLSSMIFLFVQAGLWYPENLELFGKGFEEFQAALPSLLSARHNVQETRTLRDADIFALVGHPLGVAVSTPLVKLASERLREITNGQKIDWYDPIFVRNIFIEWAKASTVIVNDLRDLWRIQATSKYTMHQPETNTSSTCQDTSALPSASANQVLVENHRIDKSIYNLAKRIRALRPLTKKYINNKGGGIKGLKALIIVTLKTLVKAGASGLVFRTYEFRNSFPRKTFIVQYNDDNFFTRDTKVIPRTSHVTIIVHVHNAVDDVRRCLYSLVQNTLPPYTIIVVDDGTEKEAKEYLEKFAKHHNLVLIRNKRPRGYIFSINQGLRVSKGDYLALLNSNTIVTPDWLERMIQMGLLFKLKR